MDPNLTFHKNRPVGFYLVLHKIFLYASPCGCVFPATACPGDEFILTLQVARARPDQARLLQLLFGSLSLL